MIKYPNFSPPQLEIEIFCHLLCSCGRREGHPEVGTHVERGGRHAVPSDKNIFGSQVGECYTCHMNRVSFVLDKKCWACAKWLLHSTVIGLASLPFLFRARFESVTVECSNHFPHTQQFLSNTKLILNITQGSIVTPHRGRLREPTLSLSTRTSTLSRLER